MSRGLGRLQREILASLEESRDPDIVAIYHGGRNPFTPYDHGSTVVHHGMEHTLPDGVYDLHAVKDALQKHDAQARSEYTGYKPAYSASFSRAVRGLIDRGYLETMRAPITSWDTNWLPAHVTYQATREIRFVRVPLNAKHVCLALTEASQEAYEARKAAAQEREANMIAMYQRLRS